MVCLECLSSQFTCLQHPCPCKHTYSLSDTRLRWCFAPLVWKDHCLTFFFIVAIFVNSDSRKIYFHTFFKFSTQLLWATVAILKINNSILSSHKNVQVYAIFTKSVLFHLLGPDLQLWGLIDFTTYWFYYSLLLFCIFRCQNDQFFKVCP